MNQWMKENNKNNKIMEKAILKSKEGKSCPICRIGIMTKRNGKFGEFLGCSEYPDCKHSAPLKKLKNVGSWD